MRPVGQPTSKDVTRRFVGHANTAFTRRRESSQVTQPCKHSALNPQSAQFEFRDPDPRSGGLHALAIWRMLAPSARHILGVSVAERKPGPTCSTLVGGQWIDDGTLCRAKSAPPGPVVGGRPNPAKAAYDSAHIYSRSPEARRKRAIDLEIIAGDYSKSEQIRADSQDYLKQLIRLASNGALTVQSSARGRQLQFFIISGGAEGFLPAYLKDLDANRNETEWVDTNNKRGRTDLDENDLLTVFDAAGKLVGSARLRRPTYVKGNLSQKSAAAVYAAWDNKTVFMYRNDFRKDWIPYLGLGVDDGFRDRPKGTGRVTIDMHKEEATNGCILIEDPATPDVESDAIRTFEPKLIKAILAAAGLDEAAVTHQRTVLGKMRMVRIRM